MFSNFPKLESIWMSSEMKLAVSATDCSAGSSPSLYFLYLGQAEIMERNLLKIWQCSRHRSHCIVFDGLGHRNNRRLRCCLFHLFIQTSTHNIFRPEGAEDIRKLVSAKSSINCTGQIISTAGTSLLFWPSETLCFFFGRGS
mmetsp:Transcript_20398/g.31450  ORF Transcript_20398/g.31450 Transcript_20398/m.31450 type:complete len:142 (+) Transcript_20398:320-745(+)